MKHILIIAAAVLAAGACKKTSNGDVVIDRPTGVTTTQDTVHVPKVGTTLDTITTPVIGTKPETLIVNKPVVGTKKTVVRRPTIKP